MRYLVIDPGETTGWCTMEDGIPLTMGQVKGLDAIWRWLNEVGIKGYDFVLVENFRIRPRQNFSWGEMPPIQIIGAIKYWSWVHDVKLYLQEPSVKSLMSKKLGITKSNSNNHALDAAAHGMYWWSKHGSA